MTKEIIDRALAICYENPEIPNRQEMISTGQSITPLIYNIVKLMKPERVLEWGPGQTTHAFLMGDPNLNVVTYESEPKWSKEYQKQLKEKDESMYDRVAWVTVVDKAELYTNPNFPDNTFDMVLIDGIFRITCLPSAHRLVKPGGIVLIHDSQNPEVWGSVETDLELYHTYQDRIQPIEHTAIYIK